MRHPGAVFRSIYGIVACLPLITVKLFFFSFVVFGLVRDVMKRSTSKKVENLLEMFEQRIKFVELAEDLVTDII